MNQPIISHLVERITVVKKEYKLIGLPEFEKYLKHHGWFSEPHTPTLWRHESGHSQVITVQIGHLEKAVNVVADFEKRTSAELHAEVMGILQ